MHVLGERKGLCGMRVSDHGIRFPPTNQLDIAVVKTSAQEDSGTSGMEASACGPCVDTRTAAVPTMSAFTLGCTRS